MNPRDQVIGGFIEKHALDFLAKFVPTESQVTFTVEPSSNENSIKGVRAMVVDDWAGALTLLKQAIVESKNGDDDESLFAAGVCCEKMNQMEDALKYYKQAQSLDPEELKYASAVSRASRSVG
jgi:tetratricopeptide (TPR) repeat protein